MSTASSQTSASAAPHVARLPSPADEVLLRLWHQYAPKAVVPILLVLATGLALLLARTTTYAPARAAGFERGRATALNQLHSRLAQNDSIRHEGELQALRTLSSVRFFYLGRHSRGWCFVKYADRSDRNYSTGWVADMRFMESEKEYALDRNGMVWSRRR